MDDETWRSRIDRDMAHVPSLPFREALSFLDNYAYRTFGAEITCGELTTAQVYRYADQALARAWRGRDQASST